MSEVADHDLDLAPADDVLFEIEEVDKEVDDWATWYELEWVLYNGEYWTEFQGYWYMWGQVHIYQTIHEHWDLLVVVISLVVHFVKLYRLLGRRLLGQAIRC